VGDRLASYVITRVLGQGGRGVVYEATHEALGKRVAIKTLLAQGANVPELTARFVREGKAAARIRHPNVVDVADVGVHAGMPYLVMEYLEGEDLAALLERSAPMRASEIADLMVPIASALGAAHAAGIVHRDLKPENVFVTRGPGGARQPKLVDFGISKLNDAQAMGLTGTHAILGTPFYMSPEQAGGSRDVDHRSDVFSLGVMLYQCATRELPFFGESLFQLLGAIMHSAPPPVRSLRSDIPQVLEAVIEKAMQKDPAARFQSAPELGAALLPLASQRVQLAFQDDLGAAKRSERPGSSAFASTELAQSHQGVQAARVPSPPPVSRDVTLRTGRGPWPLLLAGALVLAGVLGFLLLREQAQPEPAPHLALPASAAMPPAASAQPEPLATKTAPALAAAPALERDAATAPLAEEHQPKQAEPAMQPASARDRDRAPKERRKPRVRPSSASAKTLNVQPDQANGAQPAPAKTAPATRPAPVTADELFRDRK
jgi:serine/threonine-protein kinase